MTSPSRRTTVAVVVKTITNNRRLCCPLILFPSSGAGAGAGAGDDNASNDRIMSEKILKQCH
jgi:hypothetical protein